MKFKSLLQYVLVALVGQFLFACSSTEYYRFSSAKPETYHKSVAKTEPVITVQESTPTTSPEIVTPKEEPTSLVKKTEPVLEASVKQAKPVLFETQKAVAVNKTVPVANPVLNAEENKVLESAKNRLANMTKVEKKEFKKEIKNVLRDTNEVGTVVKVILAILLPPLAVFLHEGIGSRFWISLLLTLLFFIPGVIYALLVVTDSI